MDTDKKDKTVISIIIGTGGVNPGLYTYFPDTGNIEKILQLSAGNSIYSTDKIADDRTIVAATKSGLLYRLTGQENDYRTDKYLHGCCVLSVCMVDDYTIASSDISGRVLLWRPDISKNPTKLPCQNNIICALFKTDRNRLAGVGKNGKLLLWDINKNEITDTLSIPKLPPMAALVRPRWWPKAGCWVWPGREGAIVLFNPHKNSISQIQAHQSQVYGLGFCQESLVSAGFSDGKLKIWQYENSEPVKTFDITAGVISMASLPQENYTKILMAKESGETEIYIYREDRMEFQQTINVRNCRSFTTPDIEAIRNNLLEKRKKQAEELCSRITNHISNHQYDQLEELYKRVDSLGFEKASWLLRAKEAEQKSDIISQIRAYKKLTEMADVMAKNLPNVFESYACLLGKAWHIQKALSIYTELSESYGKDKYQRHIRRLTSFKDILENNQYIIEPGIDPKDLIRARKTLGQPLPDRVVIRKISSARLSSRIIFRDFVNCYNKLDTEKSAGQAFYIKEQIHWLTENQGSGSDVIFFKDNTNDALKGVELCLRFINSGIETAVTASIVLNLKELCCDSNDLEAKIRFIKDAADASGFFRDSYERINFVIRQLITKNLAQKNILAGS